jgi:hypothetical protein
MFDSNVLERDVGTVLAEAVAEASGPVYGINPSRDAIESFVAVLSDAADPAAVRLFADEDVLKDVLDDFLVASQAADLVESDTLELAVLPSPPNHSLVLTADGIVSLVAVADSVAGLTTADGDFVEDVIDHYASEWDRADTYSLRTPAISRVRETIEADIGAAAAGDFDEVLDSLQTARGDGDGIDEVTISLLVAARNGELLYDISKWGEDIGLASKATFSRTKTTLEDMGLIDTEKVPIDVGRPRLRLMLGDDRLENADADELASVAQSMLAA